MKEIKKTMFALVVALALLFVLVPGVFSRVQIIQPAANSMINSSMMIVANITGINATDVNFYYRTNSSYILIGTNSSDNLSQYRIFWNITGREDNGYSIKVNATKNSTAWQVNYSGTFYIERNIPKILSITLSNNTNNRSIFANGTYVRITLSVNESNNTIRNIYANSSRISNSFFSWNRTLNRWISDIWFIGNVADNIIFIRAIDLSNKTSTINRSFRIDFARPSILIRSETKSIYNYITGKGSKTNPSGLTNNKLVFNATDDLNVSRYFIYYDDNIINYSLIESRYFFRNHSITPQPGKHNITLVVKDILNKTSINSTTVYWWISTAANPFISSWVNRTRTTNSIAEVSLLKKSSDGYVNYVKLNSTQYYSCYYSETCGIRFNSSRNFTLEYLNIDKAKSSFFDFNWNKTPLIYFNNNSALTRSIISSLENGKTTKIKYLVLVNDSFGKTRFVYDKSIFFGRVTFDGNFSNTSRYTEAFYFRNKDNLSDLAIIRKNDSCTNPVNPFNQNMTRPCFVVNASRTSLYIPTTGLVTINYDNVTPKINISYPKSTFNDSVGLRIAFTTSEVTRCNVSLKKGSEWANLTNANMTGSSAFASSYGFTFSSRQFTDGNFNITFNCTDYSGNKNVTKRTLSISDIVPPTITIVSPTASTYSTTSSETYNISIRIDVNEQSNISYRIGNGSTYKIASNALSVTTSSVKPSGTYKITAYALDKRGNLRTREVTFTVNAKVTTTTTTSSTTSKTGIVVPQNQTTQLSNKDSEYWYKVQENIKTEMMVDNPALDITGISFVPKKNISSVKIELELIDKNIPVPLANNSNLMYQYYSIKGILNQSYINSPEIVFRVKRSWIKNNNIERIVLSRYHDSWTELPTTKLGEDSTYEIYKAVTPGFSYFVIVGIPIPPKIEKPAEIKNVTPEVNDTKDDIPDISVPVKKDKINVGLLMTIIVVISGLSLLGFYGYKTISIPVLKYGDLTSEEKDKLRKYIAIKLTTGEPIHKIETELINRGWSQDIVDNIIKTVELPRSKEHELEEFIEKMMKLRNIDKEDLRKALVNAGWQQEIVDTILNRY